MIQYLQLTSLYISVFILIGCTTAQADPQQLRLATTTSTENSGLLKAIVPQFEEQYDVRVDVIAVGTGQALALGEAGDVDVILVHAPAREASFIEAGHGTDRFQVMYNDFVLVGPSSDPANVRGLTAAADALAAIAAAEAAFASRGDDSGTHTKERTLWGTADLPVNLDANWYKSLGQGMGDTLRYAAETAAYTLTDRATFLALQENLHDLPILVGGQSINENPDPSLYNSYGVIPINPDKSSHINHELALQFSHWLTSPETQEMISAFGREQFGQPLFYPNAEE